MSSSSVLLPENVQNKKRLEYVDLSKGFTIIMVMIGHLVLLYGTAYKYIFSFHMPFFFIVSGWCTSFSKTQPPIGKYIAHSAKTILIPALVSRIVRAVLFNHHFPIKTIILVSFVDPGGEWFLSTLFASRILLCLLLKLDKKLNSTSCRIALFCGVIFVSPLISKLYCDAGLHMWKYCPLSFDCVIMALSFMIIGYFANKILGIAKLSTRLTSTEKVTMAIVSAVVLTLIYLNNSVNMACGTYGETAFALFSASFISLAILSWFSRFEQLSSATLAPIKRFLAFFGRNSVWVYIFQSVMFSVFIFIWKTFTGVEFNLMSGDMPLFVCILCFTFSTVVLSIGIAVYEKIKTAFLKKLSHKSKC